MKFHDISPELLEYGSVHKAEIMSFTELRDADNVANELRSIAERNPEYKVITCAAGMYYVILIHPEFVEDTDVTNTNP